MFKRYKFRIYPNKKQEELIQKTFGSVRFVYNQALAYRQKRYKEAKEKLSRFDCNNWKNHYLKTTYPWLKEVDAHSLNSSIEDMDIAYQRFFKQLSGFPKFKTKKGKQSYRTTFSNKNIEISFEKNKIKLPKLKWVKCKCHRIFEGKIKSVTVIQNSSKKYFASILVETEHIPLPMKNDNKMIGFDLGIKDFLITSDGDKIENPKYLKKYQNKLAKEQRKLAHKQKGSKNFQKQKIKVAKVYEKISNSRKDFLHKVSHKLIYENQIIVSENLNVSEMLKNPRLAKQISDCSWFEFVQQLEYKALWNNRTYIKVDRYFKSSQTCCICGFINSNVKNLAIRKWQCPRCETLHDRDINAAKNILQEGLKILNS